MDGGALRAIAYGVAPSGFEFSLAVSIIGLSLLGPASALFSDLTTISLPQRPQAEKVL